MGKEASMQQISELAKITGRVHELCTQGLSVAVASRLITASREYGSEAADRLYASMSGLSTQQKTDLNNKDKALNKGYHEGNNAKKSR
jgi:hypothetical protein